MPLKKFFFKFFFVLIEGTFTSVFIYKKSKNSRNQGFPYFFFACLWKDPNPFKIRTDSDPEGLKHTDPDPQHCQNMRQPLNASFPLAGFEPDVEGACAQLDEAELLGAAERNRLLQFTLSRGMALAYNPSFNPAAFNNDHSR
jgi:hypothetical protein